MEYCNTHQQNYDAASSCCEGILPSAGNEMYRGSKVFTGMESQDPTFAYRARRIDTLLW